MKNLFVSYNCGCSYSLVLKDKSLEEILAYTKKPDMEWLRWYIKDEDGEMDHDHLSPIHQGILRMLKSANGRKRES
jgi:hypothetical protein